MPTSLDAATIKEAQDQESDDVISQLKATSLNIQPLVIDGHSILCDIGSGFVRPYLPKPLRRQAFRVIHGLSHPSGKGTLRTLKEKFVWPGLRKDTLRWARECQPCQRAKIHRHNRSEPRHIDVPDNRFSHVHLDLITLPVVDDYRYCLTAIDRFSRWPIAVPIKNMQADTVAAAFYNNWVTQFGTPLSITTDQGTQFEGNLFTSLARLIGANKIKTSPYHPQSNGILERWHRTLKTALMCSPEIPWTRLLPTVLLGLRSAYKEDLGASPAEMLFGTTLRIPGEFFTSSQPEANPQAFLNNLRQHFKAIRPVPTAHHIKPRHFLLKDLETCTHVFRCLDLIKPPLTPPYSGPHKIARRMSQKNFEIDINGDLKVVSTDCLKPAYIETQQVTSPPASTATTPPPPPQTTATQTQSSILKKSITQDDYCQIFAPSSFLGGLWGRSRCGALASLATAGEKPTETDTKAA